MSTVKAMTLTAFLLMPFMPVKAAPDEDFEIYKYICVVSGNVDSWGFIPGELIERTHAECSNKGGTLYTRAMGIEPAA